jgi:alpha-L-fucosidase 2
MSTQQLWFSRPAATWTEALPLGNGRLGFMAFGGIDHDRYQINDGTAWSGGLYSEQLPPRVSATDAADAIAASRRAIAVEDFRAATQQVQRVQHRHSQSYLPFADLMIDTAIGVSETDGYRRTLDFATGIQTTTFRLRGYEVCREAFISHRDGVAVIRMTTDSPAGLALALTLTSALRVAAAAGDAGGAWLELDMPSNVTPSFESHAHPVTWSDHPEESMKGAVVCSWEHDGVASEGTAASGVHTATIYLATATTFQGIAREAAGDAADARRVATTTIQAARSRGYQALRDDHVSDHASLFGRVSISTGPPIDLPIDERLRRGNAHPRGVLAEDPALAGVLYDYGRYLLISSSRPGGLPANLQGIWNDQLQPAWSGNYTANINVEMNYWPAEVANLSECAEPLFALIEGLARTGVETARRVYGAPGWVAHHNADPWGYSQPVGWGGADPRWANWPLAPAWLLRHMWEHLLFGADDRFAEQAWERMRSAVEFSLHWLQEMPDGTLGTVPSTSPENVFSAPDGSQASVDTSSGLDRVLIADLFRFLIAIAERLGYQEDRVAMAAAAALPRINGPVIGRDGMISEWIADRPQRELDHRHVSHLYFAFPGDLAMTDELSRAVSASLDGRGDESTGWSLVWKVALRARLHQPHRVSDLLRLVFRDMSEDRGSWVGGLYDNLFVAHPPFQIDGNFGFVAGLTECFLQSHAGVIELLPAVPDELGSGSVEGIVARPGVEVSVWWETSRGGPQLVRARFRPLRSSGIGRHIVRWGDREVMIDLVEESTREVTAEDFVTVVE